MVSKHERLKACVFAGVAALVSTSVGASDPVTLKMSDGVPSASSHALTVEGASFLVNNVKAADGYGWSDGHDPDGGKDYLVNGERRLRAQNGGAASISFPGRSLTIDDGLLYNDVSAGTTVNVADLTIRRGAIAGSEPVKVTGNLTIDTSSYGYEQGNYFDSWSAWKRPFAGVSFFSWRKADQGGSASGGASRMDYAAKIVASASDTITFAGNTATKDWKSVGSGYYSMRWQYIYGAWLTGDNTENFATNLVQPQCFLTVDTSSLAGSVKLENLAQLLPGPSISALTLGGAIVSRDGSLILSKGKTVFVDRLDFTYADPSTYVTADGTNTYNNLQQPEGDTESNVVTGGAISHKNWNSGGYWQSAHYRNAILFGPASASGSSWYSTGRVEAREAILDKTMLKTYNAGSSMIVGDLTLDGTRLDYANSWMTIAVTNSLTLLAPVRVIPPANYASPAAVLTLPEGKGVIDVAKFTLPDGYDENVHRFKIVTANGVQTLYLENFAKTVESFVTLSKSESASDGYRLRSLYENGYWLDSRAPHSDTNYLVNGNRDVMITNLVDCTFAGGSLVLQDGHLRIEGPKGSKFTFGDLWFLGAGTRVYCNTYMTGYSLVFGGKLTVATPEATPALIELGGTDSYDAFESELVGSQYAAILGTCEPGTHSIRLLGDTSRYYGSIGVTNNCGLILGNSGLVNGRVCFALDTAWLSLMATNGADVALGTLTTAVGGTLDVPVTNVLTVSCFDVAGTLAKTGAGTLIGAGKMTAGVGVTILVTAGGLRAKAAEAFDGAALAFADGATYVRDISDDLGAIGLKTSGAVTAAGDILSVRVDGLDKGVQSCSVPLMTVPASSVTVLKDALKIRAPGFRVASVSVGDAGNGLQTLTAELERTGMFLVVR